MPDLLGRSRLFFQIGLSAACALCAFLTILLYFRCLRYRKGTTQWFARLEPRHFAPPVRQRLHGLDLLRTPLAALLGAGLRIGQEYLLTGQLPAITCEGLFPAACCGVLAGAMYLLLRIFCNSPLAALFAGILGPVLLPGDLLSGTLIALVLLFLGLWLTRRGDASVFGGILTFVPACLCYVCALRQPWLIWLAPLFPMAWLAVQIIRWQKSNGKSPVGRLLLSGFLILLCLVISALLLYLQPMTTLGKLLEDLERSTHLPYLWQSLRGHFPELFPVKLQGKLTWTQTPLLILCAGALIPLLHSTFSRKDSRGFVLLGVTLPFVCLWLFTGIYLLPLPMLLILGWLWSIFSLRKRRVGLFLSLVALVLFTAAQLSLTLL